MTSGACITCKRKTERLGPHPSAPTVSTWLCADCEYLQAKPDAPKVKRARRVKQVEELFPRNQYRRYPLAKCGETP